MEGAVAVAGEPAKLVGSHGAEVRFFLASAAGEEVNSTLFAMEFDSPEALGQTFDDLAEDAQLQALMFRLNGPKSPSMITSQSMGYEVPTGHTPKPGRGAVLEVHSSRIVPGRITEVISQAAEICEFVETNGAVNARSRRFWLRLTIHHSPQDHSIDPAIADIPISEASNPTTSSPSARSKTNGRSGVTANSSPEISTVAAVATWHSIRRTPVTINKSGK